MWHHQLSMRLYPIKLDKSTYSTVPEPINRPRTKCCFKTFKAVNGTLQTVLPSTRLLMESIQNVQLHLNTLKSESLQDPSIQIKIQRGLQCSAAYQMEPSREGLDAILKILVDIMYFYLITLIGMQRKRWWRKKKDTPHNSIILLISFQPIQCV